jgi:hypothetical protein
MKHYHFLAMCSFFRFIFLCLTPNRGPAPERTKSASLKAKEIKELFSQGYSKAKIARELGIGRTSGRRIINGH